MKGRRKGVRNEGRLKRKQITGEYERKRGLIHCW
jgi:hypothetical protein